MNDLKHIPLQGAKNTRDMGGYPTTDGRVTRWGMLYRSDALNELTENDWNVLRKRKIKTIIDLRSLTEANAAPIIPPEGIDYYHDSLMSELDGKLKSLSQNTIIQSMKLDYEKTLFGNLSCAAKVLNTILDGMDKGAVIFLCSAGKDRTGIIAALVLYLCGVAREDIIADYIVSSTYNANGINRKMANLPPEYLKAIPDMELLKDCLASKPETITALLDAMEHRDIQTLLAENGFPAESQKQLVFAFTEIIS